MASSERSDFGIACTTVTVGAAGSTVRRSSTRADKPALADLFDDAVRHRVPAPSLEVELLAEPDPPDVGGVEALVTVDDGELTDIRQRVDVEQRRLT